MTKFDTREIAEKLYSLTVDMDNSDYAENMENEIDMLDEAIFNIQTIAENEHNNNCWITLYNALARLID